MGKQRTDIIRKTISVTVASADRESIERLWQDANVKSAQTQLPLGKVVAALLKAWTQDKIELIEDDNLIFYQLVKNDRKQEA